MPPFVVLVVLRIGSVPFAVWLLVVLAVLLGVLVLVVLVVVIVTAAVRVVVAKLIYSAPRKNTFTTLSTLLTANTIFYRRIVCGGCGV